METVLCNYCSSSLTDPVSTIPDLYLERAEPYYSLVKCRNCGLIYQNPRPTAEEIIEAYPDDYDAYQFEQKMSGLKSLSLRYGLEKRCKSLISIKKRPGRVLDIGCSTGLFLSAMKSKYGWETYGVEQNEYAVKAAINHHLNVFHGNLEQAAYPDHYFDAVTLWDVLEHLADPAASLQEVRRILKPDGVILLRVPNYNSWGVRLFGSAWAGLDVPRHFYVFSPKTISLMLEKNGFCTPSLSCKQGSFAMFILSLRFWMYKRSLRVSIKRIIIRLANNPVTQVISSPLFGLSGLFLRGELLTVTSFLQDDSQIN